jgi:hypothetical protein
MFDLLRFALIVGVVAIAVAIGCFTYVGIAYSGSRYILAALGGLDIGGPWRAGRRGDHIGRSSMG